MKACVALVCLLGAVDFANAARAGNVGGSLRGRQRTLSYGESLAMGRTACTIYGRPVSQETELDEFKDSGCKIGGTDDKPVSCTDTELCVLKHVYGVVDQSVKAMNKVLPKNGKELIELAADLSTTGFEAALEAATQISGAHKIAESAMLAPLDFVKEKTANLGKAQLADNKADVIFLHGALMMRALQMRASLIALAEAGDARPGGLKLTPEHKTLVVDAVNTLPKSMAELRAMAAALKPGKIEQGIRAVLRMGTASVVDGSIAFATSAVYPFVAAGMKGAGLPTVGDLAADFAVFDTRTRANYLLMLAMIDIHDDIVDKVSPIFATEQFKDCDITAVNKGFQWAHWTNKPKGDPTKVAKNSLVRTDKDPNKDVPACKDVHAFAKISNAAERDIYKLSWLIWSRSSNAKKTLASFQVQARAVTAAMGWIADSVKNDIDDSKTGLPEEPPSPDMVDPFLHPQDVTL